ncbi:MULTISPECIES: hypothetical protein [unclassified Isoptericola]|uniref:hypothetical protein n=1 Tax=unclassified Isoptericola TaxID=2623355 RepID=UPI00365C6A08
MRLLSKLAVTTVAAASLLLGTAVAPATAATAPAIDVTSVKVTPSNGTYAINYKTKGYNVRTTVKVGDVSSWGEYWWADVYADVYKGSQRVASKVKLGVVASQNYKSLNGYITAKNWWGRGDFKVKNVRLVVDTDYDAPKADHWFKDASYSGGTFKMRSAIDGKLKYGNVIRVTSSGSHKTVKVGLKKFTPSGWHAYSYAKVKVQYKNATGWHTRKTLTLDKYGLRTYKFTSGTKYKYRISVAPTTKIVGGTTTATPKI